MRKDEVLKIFHETQAILTGHFLLTSGRHSDTYMQCAKLFMHPRKSEILCGALAEKFKNIKFDIIASPALGGMLMGYEMSRQLNVPNVFFERVDNIFTLKRGFNIEKGMKVAVFEDVVTTGGSVNEVIEKITALGAQPVAVGSIVDRSNGKVKFMCPYHALLSMEVKSYEAADCPLCKENKIPAVKPGSRIIKE